VAGELARAFFESLAIEHEQARTPRLDSKTTERFPPPYR